MRMVIAGCALALAVTARAADDPRPEAYHQHADGAIYVCQLVMQVAIRTGSHTEPDDPDGYVTCITKAKAETKPLYDAAMAAVKKPKAREALKSAQVAFLTAINGIPPGGSERMGAYEQRQAELKDKFTEAWARFEIER